jgi:hypothetical protein
MDEFDKDQVLEWYGWLEEELLAILKYIPPADQNLQTFSPRIATLIIESCGLLDSIFRQNSPDPATIGGKSKPRRKLDICDYAELYTTQLQLPTARSILLIATPKYLTPFSAWKELLSGGDYKAAPWWRIHTELKHDRIANLKAARLEVAIESLCALHLIIATLPKFASAVIKNSWVFNPRYNPKDVIEILEGTAKAPHSFLVESKLFVVARGFETFPESMKDFHPAMFNASDRVSNIFRRWW